MSTTKTQKRKTKRDKKLKERRQKLDHAAKREKADFLFYEATWYWNKGNMEKALDFMERALRLEPFNEEYVTALASLGHEMERPDVELKALLGLDSKGLLPDEMMPSLCLLRRVNKRYKQALEFITKTLPLIHSMKVRNKRALKTSLIQEQRYCQFQIEAAENISAKKQEKSDPPRFVPQKLCHSLSSLRILIGLKAFCKRIWRTT